MKQQNKTTQTQPNKKEETEKILKEMQKRNSKNINNVKEEVNEIKSEVNNMKLENNNQDD